ncbi:hypothetical protein [Methylobacterium planeticum]|uniref:Uncharacterized protein n=1 Tax=Methylobacterium planeticum TaxID=2615211 RepID=A0A6N6MRY6_9HYPH|nr:hypothetical protein [Methylobacterium planeticum]KAB1072295.1 hypothetical protein F6X51_16425 [Methylobacterium planeticum]
MSPSCCRTATLGGREAVLGMRRRDLGSLVCGAAIALPRGLRAQQPARPETGFLTSAANSRMRAA